MSLWNDFSENILTGDFPSGPPPSGSTTSSAAVLVFAERDGSRCRTAMY
jgi:hypothetical protein